MSERGRRYGIIDEASTLIERLPRPPDPDDAPAELTPSSGLERSTEKKPAGRTGELTEAAPPTEDLPPAGSEDATLGLDSRTLIARRRPPAEIPKSTAEALHLATGSLPSIAVPPHAERVLTGEAPISAFEEALRESTAPRIGEYALIARFPSSRAADVFLGYKVSNFGFIRRAVVKFVDRARYDYELVRQKLLDEARAISFVDHPNIVSVLDLAEDEVGTYVALEYVAGTDLRRLMVDLGHRNDRMPLEHALFIVLELLRGLAHVHAARGPRGEPLHIVHRDVNPSNILVSSDGHVKLTDFGAVLMDGRFQDATAPGTVKGKVRYLAPEYITEQTATSKVDVYGAGIVLFELVSGHPVFLARDETAAMFRIVQNGVPMSALDAVGTPAALRDILACATARSPDARYATALDLVAAIEDFMTSHALFSSPTRLSTYLHSHGLLG